MTVNSTYSVVIIARNEESHIKNTIESILSQTIKPHRIVVVDDGSTDTTPDILVELPVDVKRLPLRDDRDDIFSNTLHDIRNVGLRMVQNDPVRWVYSGDADIILPKAYCETIMKHSDECGAYIGAGNEEGRLDYLPMDSCRMIRHDWLRGVGMYTKWESVYLCVKALAAGHNTMVRQATDCRIVSQRPTGSNHAPTREYNQGRLSKRMGAPIPYVLWRAGGAAKAYGLGRGALFLRGWLKADQEVPEEMRRVYSTLVRDYMMVRMFGRFGRRYRMIMAHDDDMVCRGCKS